MIRKFINEIKKLLFFTTSYSVNVFPEPLSKDEEEHYIALLKKGNKDARNKLIEHNLRLVAHIVKKYDNFKEDQDDLISIGTIGLIKGIDSFNENKGVRITTYAARCIENEILMYLRKANKSINDLSLDDTLVNDEEGNNLTLAEIIPDTKLVYDEVELKDQKSYLLKAINNLNEREKQIMCMRYGLAGYDELTQKEVADTMNISQSYISRLEKKILHKLKKDMAANM